LEKDNCVYFRHHSMKFEGASRIPFFEGEVIFIRRIKSRKRFECLFEKWSQTVALWRENDLRSTPHRLRFGSTLDWCCVFDLTGEKSDKSMP
jgi:hypothetical protein